MNKSERAAVRVGTPRDHAAMLEFLKEMHAENGISDLDIGKTERALMQGLARYHAIVGIIDGSDGEPAASVGLWLAEWWYSDKPFWEDRFCFVRQQYRRRPFARPLIEFAKTTADTTGIPLLLGVLSNVRTAAKVRLYQRQLGEPAGAIFLWPNDQRAEVTQGV